MTIRLTTPFTQEALSGLRAGDRVLVSGVIYTARDAAHGRLAGPRRAGGLDRPGRGDRRRRPAAAAGTD